MAINFPDSPSVNDTITIGNRTWLWNGATWEAAGNYFPSVSDPVTYIPETNTVALSDAAVEQINYSTSRYKVRNATGSTIGKGALVYASGVEGSGRIDVDLFLADGSVPELTVMGVAESSILNGANGDVMSLGTLVNLDTRGTASTAISVGDEDWSNGDILYAHPTAPGKLTKVAPTHSMPIAFVVVRHQTAGQLAIRTQMGQGELEDLHNVTITSVASGEVLQYDGTKWGNAQLDALPDQTGHTGEYLTTDGTDASWAAIEAGGDPKPDTFMLMGA